jgi:hypothetical protein
VPLEDCLAIVSQPCCRSLISLLCSLANRVLVSVLDNSYLIDLYLPNMAFLDVLSMLPWC